MANDEILSLLQTLYHHRQLVRDACIDYDGGVPEDAASEGAIRALKKQGLVWQMGEMDNVSLSRPLLHLLRSAIQRRNRRMASANVDRLWEDICERITDYSNQVKAGKIADLEFIETDIRDGLHELADTIRVDIRAYADYLDYGFAYVRDLDLRIQQNERAISKARALNDYLAGMDVHQVVAVSHLNGRLRNLLQAGFAVALRQARQELMNTVHRLNDLLVTLRRDSELNKLLRVFELKLKNEPGFHLNYPGDLAHLPPALDIASCVIRPAKEPPADSSWRALVGDIYSTAQIEELAGIAQKLRPQQALDAPHELTVPEPIEDTRQQTATVEQDHPVVEAARALIRALPRMNRVISLVETREKLAVDCSISLWLAAVVNIVEALPEPQRSNYKLNYLELAHPIYSGNRWVEDIRLEYVK